jgi:hypothetical protein
MLNTIVRRLCSCFGTSVSLDRTPSTPKDDNALHLQLQEAVAVAKDGGKKINNPPDVIEKKYRTAMSLTHKEKPLKMLEIKLKL